MGNSNKLLSQMTLKLAPFYSDPIHDPIHSDPIHVCFDPIQAREFRSL
jgi:hypothetical protein